MAIEIDIHLERRLQALANATGMDVHAVLQQVLQAGVASFVAEHEVAVAEQQKEAWLELFERLDKLEKPKEDDITVGQAQRKAIFDLIEKLHRMPKPEVDPHAGKSHDEVIYE